MKLIKIFAVWCPACLIMRSRLEEIKEKFPNIEQIEYDFDIDEDIVSQYNVDEILPVVILLKNNKEILRIKGEKSVDEIEKIIGGVL